MADFCISTICIIADVNIFADVIHILEYSRIPAIFVLIYFHISIQIYYTNIIHIFVKLFKLILINSSQLYTFLFTS